MVTNDRQQVPFQRGASQALQQIREQMVERLQAQGIRHPKVLDTMRTVPRHLFMDEALSSHAYADHALPIGHGQTISQPYIVARMTEALLNHSQPRKVLEIGTGCGYQTAILAHLVEQVYTIERIQKLAQKTHQRLEALSLNNVEYAYGDGHLGWQAYAPYQAIIVTAAPDKIPEMLLGQLLVGGCLIIPVGEQRSVQTLLKVVKTCGGYDKIHLDNVSFVPLCEGTVD